jgi:Na+-transporting methylmalonyl-CoA/oxaloacetate decarboxylase gamma subunit
MKSVSLVHLSIALLILLISFPSVFVVAQLKDEIKTSDKDREKPDDVMDTTTVAPVTAAPVATPKPFCSTEAPVKDVTGKPVSLRPVVISTDALKYTETPITPVSAAPVVIPDERRSLR